jgi:hypothetical protein
MGSSEREWPKTIHVCPTCGEQFPPEQANDCCNKDGHDLRDVVAVRVVPVVEQEHGQPEGKVDGGFNGLTRAEIEATLSAPEGMADLPKGDER